MPNLRELPYTLEPVADLGENVYCIDLNDDGRDEVVSFHQSDFDNFDYLLLRTQDGNTVEQVNVPGQIRNLHFLDYDRDGTKEILVPFTHHDSLFVSIVNAKGEKKICLFLINGEPRREKDGIIPWDGVVRNFYLADADGDGHDDLITVVFTAFARLPRGVLIHSLPAGRLLGKKIVGCALTTSFIGDFNGDGQLELVAQTSAPSNGAVAGGFDDQHSYILKFNLNPPIEAVLLKEAGGQWTTPELFYDDFDGDGQREFLAFTWSHSSHPERASMELIKPGTWISYWQHSFNEPLQTPKVTDLDHDARPEILATRTQGDIRVFDFNGGFKETQRRQVAMQLNGIEILPDVDGDGVDEIIAITPDGSLLLDPQLRAKTVSHEWAISGVMHRGLGKPPCLIARQNVSAIAVELARNKFFLLNRYGPIGLWLISFGAVVVFAMTMLSLRRRHRILSSVQTLALDTDARGLLLLDPNHRIQMINTTLRSWLELGSEHRIQHVNSKDVFHGIPALAAFLREATTLPARHREATLSITTQGDNMRSVRVAADPISIYRNGTPHWLVSIEDRLYETELQRAKAWTVMAQRVAHDIKNPLSTILLTLQRLQMEYRDKAPEVATTLDTYTARIIESIEYLRQMARNFMKFVNVEKLNLSDVDLNELVQETSKVIRKELPPDIELELQLSAKLPFLRLDQDQIKSVLENLVLNAVNAMPAGGKITISTKPAQALQFTQNAAEPRDYIELEVLDTGAGIPEANLAHIFEPDFTATKSGTGLGLAIVKKIIDDHRGHIEAYSTPSVGSTFCIYLPV